MSIVVLIRPQCGLYFFVIWLPCLLPLVHGVCLEFDWLDGGTFLYMLVYNGNY